MKGLNYIEEILNRRIWFFLSILLLSNFIIRLVIYYNTTLLFFSDYIAYLNGIELIKTEGTIPLVGGNFLYFNSYIGYFFKYVLGNIDYYFVFNCFLGTLTSFFVYLICVKLTNNKLVGLLSVFLHCFYLEFLSFSSIFYTPIIMMFLLSIIIYLLLRYLKAVGYIKYLLILILLLLVNATFYFKGALGYLWILLILFGLINFKKRQILIGFVLLGTLLTISTRTLYHYHILPYKEGNVSVNDFVFFGHTLYGGDGGDGAFIYNENKERYDKALTEYCLRNQIKDPTKTDKNNFQWEEVKKFITQHPFKWIHLQFYKFCRFFGVVPESNSFKILFSGILKGQIIITAILLVLPFALMLLMIVVTFNYNRAKKAFKSPETLLLAILVLYYIAGSVFYGQYQERYRMPLMVCLLIPYLSWSLVKFNYKKLIKNKKILILKSTIILLILVIWIAQAYNALVVHEDRYLKIIEETTVSKK